MTLKHLFVDVVTLPLLLPHALLLVPLSLFAINCITAFRRCLECGLMLRLLRLHVPPPASCP